jgi:hypothetical protein
LAERSLDALASMEDHSAEELSEGISINLYHEALGSGAHKFVVQALKPRYLGLSTAIEVDGFVIEPNGAKRPLAEDETWKYL